MLSRYGKSVDCDLTKSYPFHCEYDMKVDMKAFCL